MSKCKVCRGEFKRRSMTQKTCNNVDCAMEWARRERIKAEKKAERGMRNQWRERREALKTRSQRTKEAQIAYNAYIRARDYDKPCICCGEPLGQGDVGGGYDCGHYRSTGSAPQLRFDERNAHAQRKHCNRWRGGRAVDYRIGLIARIGLADVEALESDNTVRKYTIEELIEIKRHYKAKLADLLRQREMAT